MDFLLVSLTNGMFYAITPVQLLTEGGEYLPDVFQTAQVTAKPVNVRTRRFPRGSA